MNYFRDTDPLELPGYLNRSHTVRDFMLRWELKLKTIWGVFWTAPGLRFELQIVERANAR